MTTTTRRVAVMGKGKGNEKGKEIRALFVFLIIHIFQLVFSVGTIFFSHNKSAETVFSASFFNEANGPR